MSTLSRSLLVLAFAASLIACGGGGGGSSSDTATFPLDTADTTTTTTTTPEGTNVQAIVVDGGPTGVPNLAFTSITVCVPGTTQCQTIDDVLIDTGSVGLRLVPSALASLTLPQQTAAGGDPLYECLRFVDLTHAWGPVRVADVQIAGLKASSVQVQTIGDGSQTEPSACGGGDTTQNLDTVARLGGNGIIGVGISGTDCGTDCGIYQHNLQYYSCTGSGCSDSLADTDIQVKNPVAYFPTDNNGVILQLPAVAEGGVASVSGYMIFGIGTRDNNALGSATVYTLDSSAYLLTGYNGTSYDNSFVDSGSNGLYFPDATIPTCSSATGFYCPSSTLHLSATLVGRNTDSASISFSISNTESLDGSLGAFSDLGGYYSGGFDWGLPFFFGRTVYTGYDTNSDGPFIAF